MRLQQFLDNLADAYSVKYNIEEEYQYIQDVEFDKQCADANRLFEISVQKRPGRIL